MIVSRTPFRVTLGGGGTDLPSCYALDGGFIFAMGIDKYMYVMTNPPTVDNKIRLHYSESETVDHIDELRHELAREALRYHGIEQKMEVSSMADLPAGTGMGSSSCYLVGLLNALHHYRRDYVSLQALAEEACDIELNVLKKNIGKQDQYLAAFGGMTVLEIATTGNVKVRSVDVSSSAMATLVANTHIYYTGLRRNTVDVLDAQDQAMRLQSHDAHSQVRSSLQRIKELGYNILSAIENEDFELWGQLLDQHWRQKKQLSTKVSVSVVDQIYNEVKSRFHVLGGKILGAGGGGFVMFYCTKRHHELEDFMFTQGMPRLHYAVEMEGSKIVANTSSTKAMSFHPKAMGRDRVAL